MIHNLSGSSDYLQHELNNYDPKLNRAIFNLVFWSVDRELQHALNIDGSAGEAFQFLTDRFQSAPLTQCIMYRTDLPEEVLDKIVNLIYLYSTTEDSDMRRRTGEAVTPTSAIDLEDEVVKKRPPLTTFQSLAVVNRKYYRLCLPRLWKNLVFPSPLPAPMSHWTEDILLNHAKLVKTFRFQLQDLSQINDVDEEYSEFEWSTYDNTSPPDRLEHLTQYSQFGIGLMNIRKVFKACPRLESITMQVRQDSDSYLSESSSPTTSRLISLFELVPQLQHLNLWNVGYSADLSGEFVIDVLKKLPSLVSLDLSHFKFVEKSCTEESLGWNLAQLQNLRKLRFYDVTCEDQTWNLNSWVQHLTSLDIHDCLGVTTEMLHNLISGSAPCLTRLELHLEHSSDKPDVDIQTDLPALKQLILHRAPGFPLTRFQGCKDLELIQCKRVLSKDLWVSVKHLLSTYTWPKLSVLYLHNTTSSSDWNDWKKLTEKDVDEIWNSFNIKLLIDSETDVFSLFD